MTTNEVTSSAPACTVTLQASPATLLTDQETLERRADHVAALLYRASGIAGAAKLAVRDLEGGEGSDVDGCLQAIGSLLSDALTDLDVVNLFAPAKAEAPPTSSGATVDMAERRNSPHQPINVLNANLGAAHAALDILLELTYGQDADERLESLGPKSLGTAIHHVMEQIERAQAAAGKLSPVKAQEVAHG